MRRSWAGVGLQHFFGGWRLAGSTQVQSVSNLSEVGKRGRGFRQLDSDIGGTCFRIMTSKLSEN